MGAQLQWDLQKQDADVQLQASFELHIQLLQGVQVLSSWNSIFQLCLAEHRPHNLLEDVLEIMVGEHFRRGL